MINMTQEDKELLLKDLCARLPYEVKVCCNNTVYNIDAYTKSAFMLAEPLKPDVCLVTHIEEIKPYLFPLSSMTDEQWKEITDIQIQESLKSLDSIDDSVSNPLFSTDDLKTIEWCYANHIDIHDFIPKGLAIDATGLNIYN